MQSNERDELDRIIDRALPGYSGAEPLAGLEDRVLRRADDRFVSSAWPALLRWSVAAAALASLIWLAIALRPYQATAPKPAKPAAAKRSASAAPAH